MCPAEKILEGVKEHKPDLVALSGLITPSLAEMSFVVESLSKENLEMPVLIGGATTSALHTAVKIAPSGKQPVVYVTDAGRAVFVAEQLLNAAKQGAFLQENFDKQKKLRDAQSKKEEKLVPIEEARKKGLELF
jgi:5-methyltetrahydrofolate--homocysteine methyltransferase